MTNKFVTDFDKVKALYNELGLSFTITKGEDDGVKCYLSSHCDDLQERSNKEWELIHGEKVEYCLEINYGVGIPRNLTDFYFDREGNFLGHGIW